MVTHKRFKSLSGLTRKLLAEGESGRADFKRHPDGISTDDLVAFANAAGGTILVGVDEQTSNGAQSGVIRGCDVSDAVILQILNKAVSCIPPVSVDIFIENLNTKPILRIAIAQSATRPHCTPRGVYCRRDGARNRPLHPTELLAVFLETEARAFAERFESAAERISQQINSLEADLNRSIRSMADQLGWADYKLGDTESSLATILDIVSDTREQTGDVTDRLRAIFRQDKREDPIHQRERAKFLKSLIDQLSNDKELLKGLAAGGELTVTARGRAARELTKEDLRALVTEALADLAEKADLKRYKVYIKAPPKCTEAELDAFTAIVTEGGEVSEGVGNRLKRAFRLGFVTYEGNLVGTAAIKKPTASYRKKVFENAKSHLTSADYLYELGWIFLLEPHRKRGQMTRLLQTLMPCTKSKPVFATTRGSNLVMQEVLKQLGFEPDGEEYSSARHPNETLRLWVRGAASEAPQSGG